MRTESRAYKLMHCFIKKITDENTNKFHNSFLGSDNVVKIYGIERMSVFNKDVHIIRSIQKSMFKETISLPNILEFSKQGNWKKFYNYENSVMYKQIDSYKGFKLVIVKRDSNTIEFENFRFYMTFENFYELMIKQAGDELSKDVELLNAITNYLELNEFAKQYPGRIRSIKYNL